ncbi:MAG: hypothetical protein LQ348_005066 [Seirophora lacunosa]|nr:MAG: hypothetical protein LQ344_007225 [Seirophora lacunosa]KAI4181156.1 MAG: hypothetical protein LQ348_005066 [Seirophora lacunosa]
MTKLTLDPCEVYEYSESASSSATFSYGIPTPTSSTAFSAATSRRHSTASETQACNESAYDRVPTFSTAGLSTPLETPPSFRSTSFHSDSFSCTTQGYATASSPIGFQDRSRPDPSLTANGVRFQDPFSPQSQFSYATNTPGFDTGTDEGNHGDFCSPLGSRRMGKQAMDWPISFNNVSEGSYDHTDSARFNEPFVLDPAGFIHLGLLNSPPYLGSSMFTEITTETNSPQTVSPQETFVCPNTSFIPATPICQALEDPFQTPVVKSEAREYGPLVNDMPSPCSSGPSDPSPKRRASSSSQRRQARCRASARQPSRFERRGVKRERRSSPPQSRLPLIINSQNKAHECEVCNYHFERPEHRRRHLESVAHNDKCREQGITPTRDIGDAKPWRCVVPGCGKPLTRRDNLKPHYQKTHLFVRGKNGKTLEGKKRNRYVSIEEAKELGIAEYDLRTRSGEEDSASCRNARRELSSDSDWP